MRLRPDGLQSSKRSLRLFEVRAQTVFQPQGQGLGIVSFLFERLDGIFNLLRRRRAVLLDGNPILLNNSEVGFDLRHARQQVPPLLHQGVDLFPLLAAVLLPAQSIEGDDLVELVGCHCVRSQRILFLPQVVPSGRELRQGRQQVWLAVKVGQQALAWSSLFVAIGLDQGSRRPPRSDKGYVVSLPLSVLDTTRALRQWQGLKTLISRAWR
jgi:hypothetical protein